MSGGWLSDAHMWAAMELVRRHFPEIKGLQSTLMSKKFIAQEEGSIQLHNSGAHWVTSAWMDGQVWLYDSMWQESVTPCLQQQLRDIYK